MVKQRNQLIIWGLFEVALEYLERIILKEEKCWRLNKTSLHLTLLANLLGVKKPCLVKAS